MSHSPRIALALSLVIAGCSASHTNLGDAGPRADAPLGDGGCVGGSPLICVSACGGDAGLSGICVAGSWQCPPGTRDLSTCPPTCFGPRPSADCTCVGAMWSCPSTECPADIDPWASPGTPCSVEGARCTSGGPDACSSAMFCDCEGGHWSCAVAEPDPVCWCGREPAAGDRCNEEGASCGECCPTAGGTGWDAMTCVGGHWQAASCPEIVCPPVVGACPVDRDAVLGTSCSVEGQSCGNGCCSSAFACTGGVWVVGPDLDCLCDPSSSFACGAGTCQRGQACTNGCGPTDGIEHSCTPMADGCSSCDCATVPEGYTCQSRGGTVFFEMIGFCG